MIYSSQPRLQVSLNPEIIDEKTGSFLEFWCYDNTHGVSAQLMDMPQAAVSEMMMMCRLLHDHGPAIWHRNIHPFNTSPLQSYVDLILENGPRYVQWKSPPYDDSVLWVIPGSHIRLSFYEEQAQLDVNPRVPLPKAVQANLEAGDGVV